MAQDFFYIDPKKIPPRRVSGVNKKNKHKIVEPIDAIEDSLADYFPQFNLENHPSDLNTVLVSSEENSIDDFSELPTEVEEEPADPLTLAIFSGGPFDFEPAGDFFANRPRTQPTNNDHISLAAAQKNYLLKERHSVLSELEDIENQDQELAKTLARIELTRRYDSRISPPKINPSNQENNTEPKSELDHIRANEDWFGVELAYTPTYKPKLKITEKENNSKNSKIWLAGLAIVLAPLSLGWFLFSGSQNFIKDSLGALNSKLLSASSFTLINTEAGSNFPALLELKKEMSVPGISVNTIPVLDAFMEKNTAFGWGDVFKKKAVWNDNSLFRDLGSLEKIKADLEGNPAYNSSGVFKKIAVDLDNNISWLNFWQDLFRPDQNYLVVLGDSDLARPAGGQPVSYAVVKTSTDGLEIINSGKIGAVDAASSLKVVPPPPLQVFSTAWLAGEAGWFLDFNESAKTLLNFFSDATKVRPSGVVFITKDALKSLSLKEGLIFNMESADWFSGFVQALSRKPDSRLVKMADSLNELIANHGLQFYFENNSLEKYIAGSNWALKAQNNSNKDVIGLAWLGDKPGMITELAEHTSEIYKDGSVKVKLNLSLRQNPENSSWDYYKIYLSRGSEIVKATGFSQRKNIPKFDYAGQGFSRDTRVMASQILESNKNIDMFEETGLAVLGGWLNFEPNERKIINVEYTLPFNLSQVDRGNYNIKVWRPPQASDTPFRLIISPQPGVEVLSLEPGGFVSDNSAEYQGNLSQDLNLSAGLVFTK